MLVFLALCFLLAVMPAVAQKQNSVPSTVEEIEEVAREVLANELMRYLRVRYLDEEIDCLSSGELKEIASYYPQYPRQITDSAGRLVTIYKPQERIVALNPDAVEAIRALGAKDRIVGVTENIKEAHTFFPELSEKLSVGMWYGPDVEQVVVLEPNAVFAYAEWQSPEKLEDKLLPAITIIRFDLYKPETLRDEMRTLGYLLDEEKNASEYIKWHDGYVDEIEDKVSKIPEDERLKVFLDMSGEESTKVRKTYTEQSGGISTLCERAGGINIATEADLEGTYPEVDLGWILDHNPEVIVGLSSSGGYETDDESGIEEEYERIIELLEFGNITAVEDEHVYLKDSSVPFAPGYPIGLAYMAKWFYPEEFEDLDPQAIHQEYIDKFCGIDFDVTKHGVFVYPAMEGS